MFIKYLNLNKKIKAPLYHSFSIKKGIGEKKEAIIYLHGYFIENSGIKNAVKAGYDFIKIIYFFSKNGFEVFAPLRKKSFSVKDNKSIIDKTIKYIYKRKKIKKNSINLIGFSKGGCVLLNYILSSGENKFKSIILLSTPINSSLRKQISKIETPIFFISGKYDNLIIRKNLKKTKEYFRKIKKRGVKYKLSYPGDHRWFWKPQKDYMKDIVCFIKKRKNTSIENSK